MCLGSADVLRRQSKVRQNLNCLRAGEIGGLVPQSRQVVGRSPHVVDVDDGNTALVCHVLETSHAINHAWLVRRRVAEVATHLMRGAAFVTRVQQLALAGVRLPAACRDYQPVPLTDGSRR